MRQHILCVCSFFFFFFKQKTAYEMRISDWSSDVCSSDLGKDHSQRADICVRAAWAEPSVCRQLACHPLALPSMEPQLSRAQHRLCSRPSLAHPHGNRAIYQPRRSEPLRDSLAGATHSGLLARCFRVRVMRRQELRLRAPYTQERKCKRMGTRVDVIV